MGIEKVIVAKLKLDGKGFGKNLGGVQKSVLKFTAGVTGAAAALAVAVKATANYQDEIIKAARATGSTAEEFSVFNRAAELANISADTFAGGLKKLTRPSDSAKKAMEELGVSLTDANGNMKTQFNLLSDLADGFQQLEGPQKKTALAFTLFEEAGTRFVTVLKDGSEGLNKLREDVDRFGLTVTEVAGANAEKFNDSIADLTASFSGLRNVIGESVIAFANQSGIIESLTNKVASISQAWKGLSQDTKNIVITILAMVAALAAALTVITALTFAIPLLSKAISSAGGIIGAVAFAVTALVTAISFLNESTEELTVTSARQTKEFNEIRDTIFTLSKVTKLSAIQAGKLTRANELLKESAEQLGISIAKENGELKTNIELERESIKVKIKSTIANIQKLVSQTLTRQDIINKRERQLIKLIRGRGKLEDVISGKTKFANEALTTGTARSIKKLRQFNKVRTQQLESLKKDLIKLERPSKNLNSLFEGIAKGGKDLATIPAFKLNVDPFNKALVNVLNATEETSKAVKAELALLALQYDNTKDAIEKNEIQAQIRVIKAKEAIRDLSAFAELAGQVAEKVNVLVGAFAMLGSNAAADIEHTAAVLDRDLEVAMLRASMAAEENLKVTEQAEQDKIDALRAGFDQQIADLEAAEAAKLAIIKGGANSRLLALDAEFQAEKALREQAFLDFVAAQTIKFEFDKEAILLKALDEEQRRLAEAILDNDFKLFLEAKDAEHKNDLLNLAAEFSGKKKADNDKSKAEELEVEQSTADKILALQEAKDAALVAAEAARDAKLLALEEKANADQERLGKERAQAQFDAQVAAFEATKATKTAETIASGIASAAQAFAALAPIPGIGPVLGGLASAVILAATADSVANIGQQRPIKPAELSLQAGGVLSGPSHAMGGISANLEGGEAVIDRRRTEMLISAIERGVTGGVTINVEAGAIITEQPINSPEMVDEFLEMVGQRMEREGVLTV